MIKILRKHFTGLASMFIMLMAYTMIIAPALDVSPLTVFVPFLAWRLITGLSGVQFNGAFLTAPTDSLNLGTLNAELNAFYRTHFDFIWQELLLTVFGEDGYGLGRNFTFLPGIIDRLALDSVTVNSFIHQWNPSSSTTFNPTAGAVIPNARELIVQPYEADLQFLEKEIKKSELMWQRKMEALALMNPEAQTMSFIEYLYWEKIQNKLQRDLRQAIIQAVYNPSASYGLLNILNGFEATLANEISLGTIVPFSMGTITTSNAVTEVEAVFDTLDTAVQKADDLIIALRTDVFKLWGRANRFAMGRTWQYDSEGKFSVDMYGNTMIIEEPDMVNNKCVIYRKSEAFVGMGKITPGDWRFQNFERTLKMLGDGEVGFQFAMVNPGGQINMAVGQ